MSNPMPTTYAEALELCESLANGGALDPREARGDEGLEAEVERQEQAIETLGRFREAEGALLASLPVPTRRSRPSFGELEPHEDADMTQVVPALLLSLELARSDVLEPRQCLDDGLRQERKRQQAAVALMTDLVTVHRDEVSKVVLTEVPSPSA